MLYELSQPDILKHAFKWCFLVCSAHVNMCIHHGAYVFICTGRSETNISVFLYRFLPYFLRHSLSLNLELTDWPRLAGQHAERFSCLCFPSTRTTEYNTVYTLCFTWVLEIESQIFMPAQQALSWLDHFHSLYNGVFYG